MISIVYNKNHKILYIFIYVFIICCVEPPEYDDGLLLNIPAIVNEIRPSVSVIYKRIPRTIYSLIKLRIQLFKESLNTNNL